MKAYIFDPLWDDYVTKQQLSDLKKAGIEPIVFKKIRLRRTLF